MRALGLIALCLCLAAAAAICTDCARAQISPDLAEIAGEVDALAAEIRLIEHLNTLQLSDGQLAQLIPAVTELHDAATAVEEQRVGVLLQLKALLDRRRDVLLRDQRPPQELADQIAALQALLDELDRERNETAVEHAAVFREILTDAQVSLVTGEEEARRQVIELIEWVRELDDEAFEREVPPYAAELALPDEGLGQDEIIDLLAVARAMDAAQYEREGADIGGKLIELFRPSHEAADRMIGHLFLSEHMPDVLAAMQAAERG